MNHEELNIGLTCTGYINGTIIGCWGGPPGPPRRYLVSTDTPIVPSQIFGMHWLGKWKKDDSASESEIYILSDEELIPYLGKGFGWTDEKLIVIHSRIKTLDEILNDIEDETN